MKYTKITCCLTPHSIGHLLFVLVLLVVLSYFFFAKPHYPSVLLIHVKKRNWSIKSK